MACFSKYAASFRQKQGRQQSVLNLIIHEWETNRSDFPICFKDYSKISAVLFQNSIKTSRFDKANKRTKLPQLQKAVLET